MEQARRGQDQKPRRDRLDCACCAPEREISKRRARVGEDRRQRKRQRRRQRNGRRKTHAPICAALSKKPAAAAPSAYSPRRRKDDENAEANRRAAGERVTARFFMASISAFVMSVSLAEMTEKSLSGNGAGNRGALIQSELPENSLAYTAKRRRIKPIHEREGFYGDRV